MQLDANGFNFHAELRSLIAANLPETEKLARAFAAVTGRFVESTRGQIEVARVLGDRDEKIKQQIKLETMEHARSIFLMCHRQITGRPAWEEHDSRETREGGPA
jgi:hypothetical protein